MKIFSNIRETLKNVMKKAWYIVKHYGWSMSEALKHVWLVVKLQARMHMGIVKFYFQKVDGTIREAYGTLKNVPQTVGSRKSNDSVITYYDTEKCDWRCFKIANLIRIA